MAGEVAKDRLIHVNDTANIINTGTVAIYGTATVTNSAGYGKLEGGSIALVRKFGTDTPNQDLVLTSSVINSTTSSIAWKFYSYEASPGIGYAPMVLGHCYPSDGGLFFTGNKDYSGTTNTNYWGIGTNDPQFKFTVAKGAIGLLHDLNSGSRFIWRTSRATGTSGWAENILDIQSSTGTRMLGIGAMGSGITPTYLYLGANDWDGNNLRIYSTGATWGSTAISLANHSHSMSHSHSAYLTSLTHSHSAYLTSLTHSHSVYLTSVSAHSHSAYAASDHSHSMSHSHSMYKSVKSDRVSLSATGWYRIANITNNYTCQLLLTIYGGYSNSRPSVATVLISHSYSSYKITQIGDCAAITCVKQIRVVNHDTAQFYIDIYFELDGNNPVGFEIMPLHTYTPYPADNPSFTYNSIELIEFTSQSAGNGDAICTLSTNLAAHSHSGYAASGHSHSFATTGHSHSFATTDHSHSMSHSHSAYLTSLSHSHADFETRVFTTTNELDGNTNSFFFGENSGLIVSGYDTVGVQAGFAKDKWQLVSGNGLIWRQNDTGGTNTSSWGAWKTIVDSTNWSNYVTGFATTSHSHSFATTDHSHSMSHSHSVYLTSVSTHSHSAYLTSLAHSHSYAATNHSHSIYKPIKYKKKTLSTAGWYRIVDITSGYVGQLLLTIYGGYSGSTPPPACSFLITNSYGVTTIVQLNNVGSRLTSKFCVKKIRTITPGSGQASIDIYFELDSGQSSQPVGYEIMALHNYTQTGAETYDLINIVDFESSTGTANSELTVVADIRAHSHSDYALNTHTHLDYSTTSHSHSFATTSHSHSYAATNHSHSAYLTDLSHSHSAYLTSLSHSHTTYASTTHNHDSIYLTGIVAHSHSAYAASSHSHSFATTSHSHSMSHSHGAYSALTSAASTTALYILGRTSGSVRPYTYGWSGPYMSGTNLYAGSDISLKKDITPISGAYIEQLFDRDDITYSFRWKDSNAESDGFIAQYIEDIMPEVVDGKDGNKHVNYDAALSKVVGALFKRIKEDEEKIKDLQAQINELKEKI